MTTKTKSPAQRCSADGAEKNACLAAHSGNDTRNMGSAGMGIAQERIDAANLLSSRLHQLSCLTSILYGEGFTTFSNYSDDIQDGVLWLVGDLTDDCKRLSSMALYGEKSS